MKLKTVYIQKGYLQGEYRFIEVTHANNKNLCLRTDPGWCEKIQWYLMPLLADLHRHVDSPNHRRPFKYGLEMNEQLEKAFQRQIGRKAKRKIRALIKQRENHE